MNTINRALIGKDKDSSQKKRLNCPSAARPVSFFSRLLGVYSPVALPVHVGGWDSLLCHSEGTVPGWRTSLSQ